MLRIKINQAKFKKGENYKKAIRVAVESARKVNLVAWQAVNEYLESQVIKHFEQNSKRVRSKDSTIDWKEAHVGSPFIRSSGGAVRTGKQDFVHEYAHHTGFLLETLSKSYPIGTRSGMAIRAIDNSRSVEGGRLTFGLNMSGFAEEYPKYILPKLSAIGNGIGMLMLTRKDLDRAHKILLTAIQRDARERRKRGV